MSAPISICATSASTNRVAGRQASQCAGHQHSAEAIEPRLLVTAASVGDTSNLCAELREKLIGFLQREYPEALPRRRHQIIEPAGRQLDKPMDLRK
jgi:hypothetical protein